MPEKALELRLIKIVPRMEPRAYEWEDGSRLNNTSIDSYLCLFLNSQKEEFWNRWKSTKEYTAERINSYLPSLFIMYLTLHAGLRCMREGLRAIQNPL